LCFYSKGYVQPFDGRYIGEQLSTGTYTYLIRLRPTENPKRGTVYLNPVTELFTQHMQNYSLKRLFDQPIIQTSDVSPFRRWF